MLRDNEEVSVSYRVHISESESKFVFIYDGGRDVLANDLVEDCLSFIILDLLACFLSILDLVVFH